ncbi:mutS protein homolog 5-like [Palaemon carinicauda]|uniref:mutS protein homolog 5-like n=1 Tax=Palaemon carinicauda TaxID=392227 RepID=UPI0035B587C1
MSSHQKNSSLASRNVFIRPSRFGYNGDQSSNTIDSGYNGRLARVLTSVPASVLAGAQWATRNKSFSSFSDFTESIGVHHTTRSSVGDSTPFALRGTSTGSAQLRNKSTVTFSTSSKQTGGQQPSSSSSVTERIFGPSTTDQEQSSIFTSPAAPQPIINLASESIEHGLRSRSDKGILSVKSQGSSGSLLSNNSVKKRSSDTPCSNTSDPTSSPVEFGNKSQDIAIQGQGALREDAASLELMDAEETNQIVMSVCFAQGKLGAAFYDMNNLQVYLMEDKIDGPPDFWVLHTLFREQKPRLILVGGRQDDRFFHSVRELCGIPKTPLNTPYAAGGDGNANETPPSEAAWGSPMTTSSSARSCTLKVLPMSDYKYELCLRRVLSLELPGEPEEATEEEREFYVRGKVNTEQIQMTRALGALLRFISKNELDVLSSTTHEGRLVLGVHVYAMEDLTQLDEETACALQLFSEDQHPASSKSGKYSASKEGLSVFALLSRTSCPMSPHTLRRILLRPVMDFGVLHSRYALVQWGIDPVNLETVRNMQASMKKITNVPHVMNRLQRGQLNVRDWKVLYNSLFNAILVGEVCQDQDEEIKIFKQIKDCMTEGLYHASFLIQRILDVEQSEIEARFVVRPGVDTELDEKKRRFSGLGELLQKVAEMELANLPQEVESCSLIYLPHVGYLLAFPPTPELNEILPQRDYSLPGLEFMFRTADLILYKSFTCCEMDRELGDIQVDIANHETRIMMRLVESLIQQSQNFTSLVDNILMLDCLLAFAIVSREFGWTKPELTNDPILEMTEARHPLYELCTPTFVANPVRSGPPNPCVTLITGPNASGKTVYLKQVGVLVVLAQIGCFVPATRVRLKPVDAIITVTQATPSVTSSLSAFMSDLSRMSNVLSRATKDSLIIIDEFGAATYENDGAALLTACLDYLCQRTIPRYSSPPSREKQNPYCAPPHVFVSTHLLQVYDHLQYKEAVRCLVLEAVEEEGSVVPLYLVTEGRAKKSYAAAVAALAGIPQMVVDRANRVYKYIRKGCLPPKWSLIDDKEERKRCEAVVALLLSHDLENDPLGELLSNIRRYAQPPTESTTSSPAPSTIANITPVPKTPGSKSSTFTQNTTRSTTARGSKAPQSALLQSRTEGISHTTEEEIPDMSQGEKEEIVTELSSDMTSLKMCVETVFSTGDSGSSARNISSSREKIKQPSLISNPISTESSSSVCSNVEKHLTTETDQKTKPFQESSLENIKKLAVDFQHSPPHETQSFTTLTSSNSDRKRKLSFTAVSLHAPLETSKSISDVIHRPQKCLREGSTSFFNAEETFEKAEPARRRTSGKLSMDFHKQEMIKITFQDQESLSGTSCSQESLLLQASWERKSAGGQQSTQHFQNLSSHNFEKENKSPFSFQGFSSDTNQNANLDTTSSLEKGKSPHLFLKGILRESSHSNANQSKKTMQTKHQISEKPQIKINREATKTFSQFKQTPSSMNCSIESLPFQKNRMAVFGQQDTQGFHISLSTSLTNETKSASDFLLPTSSIDQTAEISSSPSVAISKKLQKTQYQLTSEDQDQESDSGMSYSQESLPLQRDWMAKLGDDEDNTQGFPTTNLEKQ